MFASRQNHACDCYLTRREEGDSCLYKIKNNVSCEGWLGALEIRNAASSADAGFKRTLKRNVNFIVRKHLKRSDGKLTGIYDVSRLFYRPLSVWAEVNVDVDKPLSLLRPSASFLRRSEDVKMLKSGALFTERGRCWE